MIPLYRIVLIVGMELKTLKKEQLFKVKERHNQLLCSKTGTMNIEYRTEYLELTNRFCCKVLNLLSNKVE
ncbi:hypothetical protein SJ818_13605 [Enterococcus faecium]|nr:hypothetical protein [Enterococcus faecium]HAZ0783497.1 hypothetical protein [Enterococcus faecium]